MRLRHLISLVCFLKVGSSLGQDYQYAQFYALPLYYNPAFAGANLNSRLIAGYRNQLTGLDGWKGFITSYDWYSKKASSGFGVFFSNNKLKQLGYSQTTGMLQYAYRGKFNSKIRISTGVGIGFGQMSFSLSGLTFGDQIRYDPYLPNSGDALAGQSFSASYLDLQLGFLVYSQKWWASGSFLHPHSPTLTSVAGQNIIDPRINISGGYRLELEKVSDYKGELVPKSITPAVLFRSQGAGSQLDLGIYVHYVPLVFGLWYRGIPTKVKGSKSLNHDALTALVGVKQNNLSIGYSYDLNLSGLVPIYAGSHEITVTYEFKTKYLSLKGSKPTRALPCPSF